VNAVKVAAGGTFPEEVIQLMKIGFSLFESPKGKAFQPGVHLLFLHGDIHVNAVRKVQDFMGAD